MIDECLLPIFKDNTQAWLLQTDGTYLRAQPGPGEAPYCAQQDLLARLAP